MSKQAKPTITVLQARNQEIIDIAMDGCLAKAYKNNTPLVDKALCFTTKPLILYIARVTLIFLNFSFTFSKERVLAKTY